MNNGFQMQLDTMVTRWINGQRQSLSFAGRKFGVIDTPYIGYARFRYNGGGLRELHEFTRAGKKFIGRYNTAEADWVLKLLNDAGITHEKTISHFVTKRILRAI